MNRIIFLVAGLMGAASVGLGAFQSHGLENVLANQCVEPNAIAERLAWCDTAVKYLFLHAIALMAIAAYSRNRTVLWKIASIGLLIGCAIFCGSLLAMSLAGYELFRSFAPYGGMTLIAAWLLVAVAGATTKGELESK